MYVCVCVCVCVCVFISLYGWGYLCYVDTVFGLMGFFPLLSWMFQHDCLDACWFECLICMCFVFLYLHLLSAAELFFFFFFFFDGDNQVSIFRSRTHCSTWIDSCMLCSVSQQSP